MKVLYIATSFTAITHTFITREVSQLQQAGLEVDLLSVRTHPKAEGVVNPECDLSRSRKIYPVSVWQLLVGVVRALLTTPRGLMRGIAVVATSPRDSVSTKFKLLYQLGVASVHAPGIRAEKYDRIHAHFASSPTTFALFYHFLTSIPFSFTGHAADIFREPSAMKGKLEYAAGVVAISGYNHDYYNTVVPGLITDRIHCGIDPTTYVYKHRDKPGNTLRVLAVGRSVPKKGFSYLLDALKILSERDVEWSCDIVGGGPLEEELKAQAAKQQLHNLHLHGSMQQEEIRKLIDDADVFVLPCIVTDDGDRDNIPVSLMEAMAAGCPVISTDVAGIPELLGENNRFGLTVNQRDAHSIADALLRMISDHEMYAELSRNGRTQVEDNFNVQRSAQQLVQFFANKKRQKKTRVCYVLNKYAMGGAETVALDLARRHDSEHFDVEVVAVLENRDDHLSEMHRRFVEAGIKTSAIYQDNFRNPIALVRFISFLRKGNFDVVLGHNRGSDYWAVKLGQIAGVKHRYWTRHLTYQDMSSRQIKKYRSVAGTTEKIVAVSEAVNRSCVEVEGLPADKVVTIVNGIDMQKFCPIDLESRARVRKGLGVRADEKVILFVGRFNEQKAPESFIDLIGQVRKTNDTVRGFMCGHGPLDEILRSRADGVDGVEVLGLRSDISDLLGACDLFVSTSRNEGLPLNIMEAMCTGVCFVGPDIPQVRELVAGEPSLAAQLFVAPPTEGEVGEQTVSLWSEKVLECLADEKRLLEVGRIGREVIGRKFSLELMVERYEEIYNDAMNASR